jgi:hypothetical protein
LITAPKLNPCTGRNDSIFRASEGEQTMTKTVSITRIFLARLVLVLMVSIVVLGVVMHGLSMPVF